MELVTTRTSDSLVHSKRLLRGRPRRQMHHGSHLKAFQLWLYSARVGPGVYHYIKTLPDEKPRFLGVTSRAPVGEGLHCIHAHRNSNTGIIQRFTFTCLLITELFHCQGGRVSVLVADSMSIAR